MKKFTSVKGLVEYATQEGAEKFVILPIFEGVDMCYKELGKLKSITRILEPGINGRITMTNRVFGRLNKLELFNQCKTVMSIIKTIMELIKDRPGLLLNIRKQFGDLLIWVPYGMFKLDVSITSSEFSIVVGKFNDLGYTVGGYMCIIDPFSVSYNTQTVLRCKLRPEKTVISRINAIDWKSANATVVAEIHARESKVDNLPVLTKSAGYVENNHLHVNDYVTYQIDELCNVQLKNIRRSKTSENNMPIYCPCCSSPLSRSDNHLICTEASCIDTNTDKLEHWCKVLKITLERHHLSSLLLSGVTNIVDLIRTDAATFKTTTSLTKAEIKKVVERFKSLESGVSDGTLLFGVFPFGINYSDCKSLNSIDYEEIVRNPLVREGYIYLPDRIKETLTLEYSVLSLLKKMIGEGHE